MIITDQLNQTAQLYEIQVTVIYSRAILVAVTSECSVKRFICKTWTGTLANSADPDQTLHCLPKLQEVVLNVITLFPYSGPCSQSTLRATSALSALIRIIGHCKYICIIKILHRSWGFAGRSGSFQFK